MSGKRSIPKGWTKFTNLGNQLLRTPFVPFKVPLQQGIAKYVPETLRFTPQDLLEQLPRLKLIINLTNAKNGRYYRYQDFKDQGVNVFQIMCEGHGVLPKPHQLQSFYDVVDGFLRAEPGSDGIIGVHCTHGLNRTGYFICKYLIEKMKMSPDSAIELFETARGHHIERWQYTQDLRMTRAWEGDGSSSTSRTNEHRSAAESNRSLHSSIAASRSQPSHGPIDGDRPRAMPGPSRGYQLESVANWRDPEYRSSARFRKPYQTPRNHSRGYNCSPDRRYETSYENDSRNSRNNSVVKNPYKLDRRPRSGQDRKKK